MPASGRPRRRSWSSSRGRRHPGQLFLIYSANWFNTGNYAMGYATCSSPTGPCTNQSTSPWVDSGANAAGPGGPTVFAGSGGTWWLGYHAWAPNAIGSAPGAARSLHLDELAVDGTALRTDAPTVGVTPGQPSG
jgi:hypothetical protein